MGKPYVSIEKPTDHELTNGLPSNGMIGQLPHSIPIMMESIKRAVKRRTNRALQCNAVPIKKVIIRIPVTLIDDDINDQLFHDVASFCIDCARRFGITPIQTRLAHRLDGEVEYHGLWAFYRSDGTPIRMTIKECHELQLMVRDKFSPYSLSQPELTHQTEPSLWGELTRRIKERLFSNTNKGK